MSGEPVIWSDNCQISPVFPKISGNLPILGDSEPSARWLAGNEQGAKGAPIGRNILEEAICGPISNAAIQVQRVGMRDEWSSYLGTYLKGFVFSQWLECANNFRG